MPVLRDSGRSRPLQDDTVGLHEGSQRVGGFKDVLDILALSSFWAVATTLGNS